MMIPRRGFLAGLGALLAAPAIIRTPGLLMPVRPLVTRYDMNRQGWWIGGDFTPDIDTLRVAYTQTMTRAEFDRTFVGSNPPPHNDWYLFRNGDTREAQRRLIFNDWSDGN